MKRWHAIYDSNSMTSEKRQKYGDSKEATVVVRCWGGRGEIGWGLRIFRAVEVLCMIL